MQQDMGISQAPPHLGAPFPLFEVVHVRKPRSKKVAMISLTHSGHLCVLQSVFSALLGATCKASGNQKHERTHSPRKYFEVHSTASEGVTPKMTIQSEAKRVRVSEIFFLKTYFGVGNYQECNGNPNTWFSKLFLDLRRTAADSFVFQTHAFATLQLQGSG